MIYKKYLCRSSLFHKVISTILMIPQVNVSPRIKLCLPLSPSLLWKASVFVPPIHTLANRQYVIELVLNIWPTSLLETFPQFLRSWVTGFVKLLIWWLEEFSPDYQLNWDFSKYSFSLQTHHVYSTLKGRGNDRTWKRQRGIHVVYL